MRLFDSTIYLFLLFSLYVSDVSVTHIRLYKYAYCILPLAGLVSAV